ncbi:endonuclease/exonuclease/phosphatase family protein [Arthrobacter agilis]|uniref:endonuclease/exonuclease/phosphatase family protein n=1 Tax=Arthrobacter agilis TaxID=37921 RepID=UPI001ABFF040|nr:endonuclease/exonuclease/phosphatase family protein [Arthrobacter agilis]
MILIVLASVSGLAVWVLNQSLNDFDDDANGADSYHTPDKLLVTDRSENAAGLTWKPVTDAKKYRVQLSKYSDMGGPGYLEVTSAGVELRGLEPNQEYFVRVRVISEDGDDLSDYSKALAVRTEDLDTPHVRYPLSVASFNVKCANCYSGLPEELPWRDRREAVVETITSRAPDVLGLQEASQGWLRGEDRSGSLAQFEDLVMRVNDVGPEYALTNDIRNNCRNPTTPAGCDYEERGASKGTRIIYNTETIEYLRGGAERLPFIGPTDNERYFVWGIFRQIASGREFFFGNTHLEPRSGSAYFDLRREQASMIVDIVQRENQGDLPAILVGDFNSHRWTEPSNAPYEVMSGAGYTDPLGGTEKSPLPDANAYVERRIGTYYDSVSGFSRSAGAYGAFGNGRYIDYIFTSPMRVSVWETVVKVDSEGDFIGIIPSDHNMIRAEVELPDQK